MLTRHHPNRGLVSLWVCLAVTALAQIPASSQQGLRLDARLSRPVTVIEPSIPLADLLKKLTSETGVGLRVDDAWREVRVAVLVRNRPLQELMTALQSAFPPLHWATVKYPNQPPIYKLRYEPQERAPAPRDLGASFARVRSIAKLIKQLLSQPQPPVLNTLMDSLPDGVDAQEWRIAIHLYQSSLPTYITGAEALLGRPNPQSGFYQVALQALTQLDESDWQQLAKRSSWATRITEHPRLGITTLALWQTAELEFHNSCTDTKEKSSQLTKVDDLLIHFWFDEDGNFYCGLMPLSYHGGEWRAAGKHEFACLVPAPVQATRPWKAAVPNLPAFEKPLPPTPEYIRQHATWYNALGCLLLEVADAAQLSLVAPIFPFYAAGTSEANCFANATAQMSDILNFRVPSTDLPKLCRSTGLAFALQGDWLIATHADLEQAREDDIPDSLLKQLFPTEWLKREAWLLQVGQQLVTPSRRALPMLRLMMNYQGAYTDVPDLAQQRYELPVSRDASYYWMAAESKRLYSYPSTGLPIIQTELADDRFFYRYVWEFFLLLSPDQRRRALSGGLIEWNQMNPDQRRAFYAVVQRHPLTLLSPEPPLSVSFSIRFSSQPIEYLVPPDTVVEHLCLSDNPFRRYLQAYWAQSWNGAETTTQRILHQEEVWELRFVWGASEVRYTIRRIGLWDWLQSLCKQRQPREQP